MNAKKLTLAAVLTAGVALPMHAQEVDLALSHWVPGSHPLQVTGMEPWAESIREASDGRIAVTIYPAQQLGAAADHYDMARDGVVDIGFINPGYQPGRFPILSAGEIPFVFSNAKAGSRALHEWYQDYAEQEMSDVFVCLVHLHDPGTLHGREPIVVPSDLAGKNIRPAHGTMARMVNRLGGASVQVSASEIRELLSRGAADITASPWGSLFTFNLTDEVTHHLDMPFYATVFAFVINQGVMDNMSDENRAVMEDHCTPEWSERMASEWADIERSGRERLMELDGNTLHEPTAEQTQEWRDATAFLQEEWQAAAADAGVDDPEAAWEDLLATVEEHGARAE